MSTGRLIRLESINISASPRLKDAEIPEDKMATVYAEMIVAMRRMFQVCRLVHADLSEYNVLYVRLLPQLTAGITMAIPSSSMCLNRSNTIIREVMTF